MFRPAHIRTKRLFTSLSLLLRLSFLGKVKDIDFLLTGGFNESASSTIDLGI